MAFGYEAPATGEIGYDHCTIYVRARVVRLAAIRPGVGEMWKKLFRNSIVSLLERRSPKELRLLDKTAVENEKRLLKAWYEYIGD